LRLLHSGPEQGHLPPGKGGARLDLALRSLKFFEKEGYWREGQAPSPALSKKRGFKERGAASPFTGREGLLPRKRRGKSAGTGQKI